MWHPALSLSALFPCIRQGLCWSWGYSGKQAQVILLSNPPAETSLSNVVTDTCVATCSFLCGRCGFELKSPCLFNKCSYLIRCPLSPYFCSLTDTHFLVSLIILHCLDIFKFICAGKVCLFKNTFISKFGSLDKGPLKSLRTLLTPHLHTNRCSCPRPGHALPTSLLSCAAQWEPASHFTVISSSRLERHLGILKWGNEGF